MNTPSTATLARLARVVLCAVLALTLAACGDDGADATTDGNGQTSGANASTSTNGGTAGGDDVGGGGDVAEDVTEDVGEDAGEDAGEDTAPDDVAEDVADPGDVGDGDTSDDDAAQGDVGEDAQPDAPEDTGGEDDSGGADDASGDVGDDGGGEEACAPAPGPLPEVTLERSGRFARWSQFPGGAELPARDVVVYLPRDYDTATERHYPVLYMHDGQNLFDAAESAFGVEWQVDETMDALVDAGVIEPWIVVGVYNAGANRINEYTPDADPDYGGGQGEAYMRWLADVLKPTVEATLRTRCGAMQTAVAGSSLGGLISFEIGQRYGDRFGRVGSLSPSFWWNGGSIMDRFENPDAAVPPRLWIDAGTEEGGYGLDTPGPQPSGDDDLSSVTRNARRVLRRALALGGTYGDQVGYLEAWRGLHNEAAWAERMDAILTFMLSDAPPTDAGAELSAYVYRPRLLTGASTAVSIEARYASSPLRLTWPLEALALSTTPPDSASLDALGHLRADQAGTMEVTAQVGAAQATFALEAFDAQTHASVLFRVSAPLGTPDEVHISGSAGVLGEWDAGAVRFHPIGASGGGAWWRMRVPLERGAPFEYKYNLGAWERVEKGSQGEELGNRSAVAEDGLVLDDQVLNWAGF